MDARQSSNPTDNCNIPIHDHGSHSNIKMVSLLMKSSKCDDDSFQIFFISGTLVSKLISCKRVESENVTYITLDV